MAVRNGNVVSPFFDPTPPETVHKVKTTHPTGWVQDEQGNWFDPTDQAPAPGGQPPGMGAPGSPPFDFSFVPNLPPEMMQIYSAIMSSMAGPWTSLLSGQVPFDASNEEFEDFLQKGVFDPLDVALEEDILPQVRTSFTGPGYWGSDRAKAEGRAVQDTEERKARISSEMRMQNEFDRRRSAETAQQTAIAGLGPFSSFLGTPFQSVMWEPWIMQLLQSQMAGSGAGARA